MNPARGTFTLSLDFELVWGSRDLYDPLAPLLKLARRTRERVFEPLLSLFVKHDIIATWATVGSLFCDRGERAGGVLFPDVTPPRHAWHPRPWFDAVPEGTEAQHPEFYAQSLVLKLRDAGQEIGSHSFSHPIFGDPGCSREAADSDLARCVREANSLGIKLRSFVFPRNVVGHVDLLKKYGFTAWRGPEPVWYRHPAVPGPVKRLAHLAEVAAAVTPPTVLPWRDEHGLWVIPASASLLPIDGVRRAIPLSQRVKRCIRGLDAAARDGGICHLWSHPINLASEPERMVDAMRQVVEYAVKLREQGRLDILSMGEIATRADAGTIATNLAAKAPSARF